MLEHVGSKMAGLGTVLGASGRHRGSGCDLDCLWSSIWVALGAHLGGKMGQDDTKMAVCYVGRLGL